MSTFSPSRAAATVTAAILVSGVCSAPLSAEPLSRSHFVLPSAIAVDARAHTIVLPLHRGTAAGRTVWYITTDSSDRADAQKRGLVFAPALANVGAGCARCVATITERAGAFVYPAAPDFSPERRFTPGPTGFPPAAAAPGAQAESGYSPFVRIGNGAIVNAPIVATGDAAFDVAGHRNTADRVLAIDTAKKTVTLLGVDGFAGGRHVIYLSTESSDPGAAAIERATYVKSLAAASGIPIFAIANGRNQGLAYDALRGGLAREASLTASASLLSPLNVLASFPTGATASAYTPLWNANVAAYSKAGLAAEGNSVQTSAAAIARLAAAKALTAPGGKPLGPAGFVVNCPVVAYVDGAP